MIVTAPSDVLKQRCEAVTDFTGVKELVSLMSSEMLQNNGIGLAAPQVGVLKRVIVFLNGDEAVPMINPVIDWRSSTFELAPERCLSVPGREINVLRSTVIKVSFQDVEGRKHADHLYNGLLARVLQHEVDHLDGVLITDKEAKHKHKR